MTPGVTFVTDGTAISAALARWISQRGVDATLIQADDDRDAARVIDARRGAHMPERTVALSRSPAGADIEAAEAVEVIAGWLEGMSPIAVRAFGSAEIERRRIAGATGDRVIEDLLDKLAAWRPSLPRGRRGRPRRSEALAGTGMVVAGLLMLHPERRWTERDLAFQASRSAGAVHKALVELDRRGFVFRERGNVRPRESIALRDAMRLAWKGLLGSPRGATYFAARKGLRTLDAIFRKARKVGSGCVQAGSAALEGPERFVGEPTTLYVEDDGILDPVEFIRVETQAMADVVLWQVPSPIVFLEPRVVGGLPATNRVVTWLDLVVTETPRHMKAAEVAWEQT